MIIDITPELNRRVLAERRFEPRERIRDLEQRLARIVEIILDANYPGSPITEIYRLAKRDK